jgi:branched-chain amino acid transport system substrate-binding protein
MNSRTWLVIALSVAVSLALVVAGCRTATPEPTAEAEAKVGEPYKIGVIVAITGPASALGVPERNTVELLNKEVEAAGGIMGPDGLMHPVKVFIYDTESDETKTVLATKKLIEEDQVSIIIGPSQSGTSLAIVDTVQKAEVPLVSLAASVKIVEPVAERKWVFKVVPLDRLFASTLIDVIKGQGISKLAWMSVNNAYGDSGWSEFEPAASEAGIAIVASERFEATDTDMTAQLTKIRGTDAEGLVIWAIPPAASMAQKNAFDLGLEMPVFQSPGAVAPRFVELATEEAVEGVMYTGHKIIVADQLPDSDPQKTLLLKYVEDYEAEYGTPTNTFGGHAWDAYQIAVQVLGKVGPDRAAVRDELERTRDFVGATGIFNFSASDHVGLDERALVPLHTVGGQFELVTQ